MDISLDLTTADGRNAEVISQLIELRRKELGETAKQSCLAMALNILRSIRAQTKIANEKSMDIEVRLADDEFYPSFARDKGSSGKNISSRVLRQGKNGAAVKNSKVIWLTKKYIKGEVLHSFVVRDKISDDKIIEYLIVAPSAKEAKDYVKKMHQIRVKRHRGLAKFALGAAMKQIYDKGNLEAVSPQVRQLANANIETAVKETGFNSGEVSIYVHDNLNYAVPALKAGENSVQIAVANAMNKTVGLIKQRLGGSLDQSLKMRLEELGG